MADDIGSLTSTPVEEAPIRSLARFKPVDPETNHISFNPPPLDGVPPVVIVDVDEADRRTFLLDTVLDEDADQIEVLSEVGVPLVEAALQGYNATVLVVGPPRSGKHYALFGNDLDPSQPDEHSGLIVRSAAYFFECIAEAEDLDEVSIRCSLLEVHGDEMRDLLSQESDLALLVDNAPIDSRCVTVTLDGLHGEYVDSALGVGEVMRLALINAKGAAGRVREKSNEFNSHIIVSLFMSIKLADGRTREARIRFCYIADVPVTDDPDSPSAVAALTQIAKQVYEGRDTESIPFRQATLTSILQEAIFGNSITLCLATTAGDDAVATAAVLQLAEGLNRLQTRVQRNEARSSQDLLSMLRLMQNEYEQSEVEVARLQRLCKQHGIRAEDVTAAAGAPAGIVEETAAKAREALTLKVQLEDFKKRAAEADQLRADNEAMFAELQAAQGELAFYESQTETLEQSIGHKETEFEAKRQEMEAAKAEIDAKYATLQTEVREQTRAALTQPNLAILASLPGRARDRGSSRRSMVGGLPSLASPTSTGDLAAAGLGAQQPVSGGKAGNQLLGASGMFNFPVSKSKPPSEAGSIGSGPVRAPRRSLMVKSSVSSLMGRPSFGVHPGLMMGMGGAPGAGGLGGLPSRKSVIINSKVVAVGGPSSGSASATPGSSPGAAGGALGPLGGKSKPLSKFGGGLSSLGTISEGDAGAAPSMLRGHMSPMRTRILELEQKLKEASNANEGLQRTVSNLKGQMSDDGGSDSAMKDMLDQIDELKGDVARYKRREKMTELIARLQRNAQEQQAALFQQLVGNDFSTWRRNGALDLSVLRIHEERRQANVAAADAGGAAPAPEAAAAAAAPTAT